MPLVVVCKAGFAEIAVIMVAMTVGKRSFWRANVAVIVGMEMQTAQLQIQ